MSSLHARFDACGLGTSRGRFGDERGGPRGPIGFLDGIRLTREARAANAELEGVQRTQALLEVTDALTDVRRRNAEQRDHEMRLAKQQQTAARTGTAISLASDLFDLTVSQIGDDAAKASYLQPLLAAGVEQLQRNI